MMAVRGIGILAVLFGSFCAMNAAHAQISMTRSQADPADKLFRLVAPDGTVVVADGETKRFFIETPGGASFEFTFDQAVAAAEPDSSKRAKLKADFEAALADARLANYSYVYQPDPGSCVPPPGKIFCEIQPFTADARNQSAFAEPSEEEEKETHDLDTVTVTARRPIIMIGGGGSGWGYWPGGMSYSNPYTAGSQRAEEYQRCWAEDYDEYKTSQADSCFAANTATLGTLGSMALAADACVAAAVTMGGGGISALGCGGAVILLVASTATTFYYDSKCVAEYTAPEHC